MAYLLTLTKLRWFNERFAVVDIGGKCRILRVEDASLYDEKNFKLSVAGEHGGKGELLAIHWLHHPKRRHYKHGVDFDPNLPMTDDPMNKVGVTHYNLWKGLPIEPIKGDVQLFIDFVQTVICSDDKVVTNWILDWLADLVQNPGVKPGTAVVLRGEQGVGKSTFAEIVGELFGPHFVPVGDPEQLVGRFAGHLKDKLLVYADEGSFASDKDAAKLKHMLTAERMTIEEKFQTPMTIKNSSRFIFCGNVDRLIYASHDERRYCISDVSPCRKSDTAYWNQLRAWADNGGINALMHFLLSRSITSNLREVPNTEALQDHKIRSMSDVARWFMDRLADGHLVPVRAWTDDIPIAEVMDAYIAEGAQRAARLSTSAFGKELARLIPRLSKTRPIVRGKRTRCYRFPSLSDCRQAFTERFGLDADVFDDGPALQVVSDSAKIEDAPDVDAGKETKS
jgi:hypothetical protein